MLETIILTPFHYRGQECLGLSCSLTPALERKIRMLKGIKWCGEKNWWYLPLQKDSYLLVHEKLSKDVQFNTFPLKQYLDQRKHLPIPSGKYLSKRKATMLLTTPLSTENAKAFEAYHNMLTLKGYSKNTIKTYCSELYALLRLLGKVSIASLTKAHVQSYLLWLLQQKGYSEAGVHTAVNALKFYFEKVEGREKEFYDLPRPKKARKAALRAGRRRNDCPDQGYS
jgi:hypothetical protein